MSYLRPFDLPESANLAGILQLRLARVDDIATFPRIIGGKLHGNITFKAGLGWVTWGVIYSSDSFTASSLDSMEGPAKSQRLSFILSSRTTEEILLDRMERDRWIAYYLDANLNPVVIGTPDRPLTFRYSYSSGSLIQGRNQYDCSLSSEARDNRAIYTGTLTDYDPKVVIRYNSPDGDIIATLSEGDEIDFDGEFDYSEVILPLMPSGIGRFATIHYTKDSIPLSAQVELGKTIIIQSDFNFEFDMP